MKIAIIGCGNMGMAFANSFIQYNLVHKEDLLLIEKNQERGAVLQEQKAGVVVDTISDKISGVDLVILSVKPQDYASVASTPTYNSPSIWHTVTSAPVSHIEQQLPRKIKYIFNHPDVHCCFGCHCCWVVAVDGCYLPLTDGCCGGGCCLLLL